MNDEDESGPLWDERRPRPRRSHPVLRFVGKWLLVAAIWMVAGIGILLAVYASDLPDVHQVAGLKKRPGITLLAADGSVLSQSGDLYGNTLAVSELPPNLVHAVVSIEDRRFYHHFGVDPFGLLRALVTNARRGYTSQGGSTLTQQLAKNMFLTPERTFKRKLQEALLAVQLERYYTKDQILTGYLNRVYLGAGAFGVDAAAKTYFGVPATQLTLQESAIIAGLLKAPSRYSPATDMKAALDRAQLVLQAMHDEGYITDKDMLEAMSSPPPEIHPATLSKNAHYIADWAASQAQAYIGTIDRDMIVQTTIDPRLQRLAEQKVYDTISGPAVKLKASQAALVSMTLDGAVRAMVGGRDYAESQFNRATPGRAPARLVLQALRLSGRAAAGPAARQPGRRQPDPYGHLVAREFRARLPRHGAGPPGAGGIDQHRGGAGARLRRHRQCAQRRPQARHHRADPARPVDRAGHLRRHPCWR